MILKRNEFVSNFKNLINRVTFSYTYWKKLFHIIIFFFKYVQNTFIFNVNTKELKGKITNWWKSIYQCLMQFSGKKKDIDKEIFTCGRDQSMLCASWETCDFYISLLTSLCPVTHSYVTQTDHMRPKNILSYAVCTMPPLGTQFLLTILLFDLQRIRSGTEMHGLSSVRNLVAVSFPSKLYVFFFLRNGIWEMK